jgi:putative addiction module component (TIGR02574 family)
MRSPTRDELRTLSSSDRLKLLEDVWDTFVREPDSLTLTEEHRQEIERRLEAWRRDPNSGSSWPDARRRLSERR